MRFHIQELFIDFQSDDEASAIRLVRLLDQWHGAFSGRLGKG